MASLYEIGQAYNEALNEFTIDEETGELLFNEEAIDQLTDTLQNKADNIASYIKNRQALSNAIKAEKNALDERLKSNDKKIEALKKYLAEAMEMTHMDKLETARNKITFRKSTSVVVNDDAILPTKYIKTVMTEKVDKKAIGEALKAGETLPGCYLEEKQNIQIK